MQNMQRALQHRLAKRQLTDLAGAAFIIHCAKQWLDYPQEAKGYVRHGVLHMHVDHREDKTLLTLHKARYMQELQEKTQHMSVHDIRDIRFT